MRHLKKYASLLLALVMALALAAPAFAADPVPAPDPGASGTNASKGTITIDNAIPGQTYAIYKIFDVVSYSGVKTGEDNTAGTNITDGNFSYKVATAWADFFKAPSSPEANDAGPGYAYLKVDKDGYITNADDLTKDNAAEFAKVALAWAVEEEIAPDAEMTLAKAAEGQTQSTEVKFENVDLGYYLVDSTAGTLCSLNTAAPNVTIKEKNLEPGNEKKVEEDDTVQGADPWGDKNDADIGQVVNFQSTITAQAGAVNYTFHDKMSAGLTLDADSISVKWNDTVVEETDANGDNFTITVATPGQAFTDGCTFEVAFTEDFCNKLQANDEIVISYSAVLNENAVVGTDGNPNESKLTYGEDGDLETKPSKTTTYTWEIDVLKYTGENSPLANATFSLSKNKTGDPKINFVPVTGKANTYRVAKTGETGVDTFTTDATGEIKLEGLDADTYYLTEITAPNGYNKLEDPIEIKITDANTAETKDVTGANNEITKVSTMGTVTTKQTKKDANGDDVIEYTPTDVVMVLNNTGAVLPSTGGIGTTIFYVVGGVLVVGAAILLVTKKRMSSR